MTDWFGSIKSKVKDITQKLTTPVKSRHLLNFRVVLFLIIIIGIAVVVVFAQYPQVLRSFAKPPQSICGYNNTRCCAGDVCTSDLLCYSPNNTTPKKCTTNSAVCGNAVDRPCCESTISDEQDNYCNGNLACDTSKNPPYPYQNPWDSGLCALNYSVCGGQNEACCGTKEDNLIDRCDESYHCIYDGYTKDEEKDKCGYATINTTLQDGLRTNSSTGKFTVSSNIIDQGVNFNVDCGNGQLSSGDLNSNFECVYNNPGTYFVKANAQGYHDSQPAAYLTRTVVVPNPYPGGRPTR